MQIIAGALIVLIITIFIYIKKRVIRAGRCNKPPVSEPWKGSLWDMHCHILPGVDDGADSMETALSMIKEEIKEGVTDIILTPHYISNQTDGKLIQERFRELEYEIRTNEYPIRIHLGNEILFDAHTISALKDGKALTLAGSSYVLIEFETGISYQKMKSDFQELQMAGYRPILAHLERFSCLRDREDRIEELIHQGILMQANSGSFLKDKTSRFLTSLAEAEMIHFIGTDSHSMNWRPPRMKKTVSYLRNQLEEDILKKLFSDNGYKLLNNQFI